MNRGVWGEIHRGEVVVWTLGDGIWLVLGSACSSRPDLLLGILASLR